MLYGVIIFILVSYLLALVVDIVAYVKIGSISGFTSIVETSENETVIGIYV